MTQCPAEIDSPWIWCPKGQYSGQKSLFFPQPWKSGKAISSLFFAVLLVLRLVLQKDLWQNGCENEENGAKRQNFRDFRLEIAENSHKVVQNFHFFKMLIYSHPPGGTEDARIFTIVMSGWKILHCRTYLSFSYSQMVLLRRGFINHRLPSDFIT